MKGVTKRRHMLENDQMETERRYALLKLRGRPPRDWFQKSAVLRRMGADGYRPLRVLPAVGMFDQLLSPEFLKIGSEFLTGVRQEKRARQMAKPRRREAAARGRASQAQERLRRCEAVLEAYRGAHPEAHPEAWALAAIAVAKWHVARSDPDLPYTAWRRAVNALTRQLRRHKQAS